MRRSVLGAMFSLPWLAGAGGCAHAEDNSPVGLTLLFLNKGKDYIVVQRFDPDGRRGPVPGALGVGGGAEMSFMPGDGGRGVPGFVEVGWQESTPAAQEALDRLPKLAGRLSEEQRAQRTELLNAAYALRHHYSRRIDLTSILAPALLAKVRADRNNTQLKLTVTFKGEDVSIEASAEKWR